MRILHAAAIAREQIRHVVENDCCVFARSLLALAYGREVIAAVPLKRWHLWADTEGVGPWEPVLAAEDAGIAFSAPRTPPDEPRIVSGRWHLCQGWRGKPLAAGVSGHTFLWWAASAGDGLLLDSTRARGPRAIGLQRWTDVARPFVGGLAVVILKRPAREQPRRA